MLRFSAVIIDYFLKKHNQLSVSGKYSNKLKEMNSSVIILRKKVFYFSEQYICLVFLKSEKCLKFTFYILDEY